MFEQEVEGRSMVMMPEVAELMEEDIVLEGLREADDVQVEIDVGAGRAAAPVGGVVLDGHVVVYESIPCGEFGEAGRKFGLGLTAECGDFFG